MLINKIDHLLIYYQKTVLTLLDCLVEEAGADGTCSVHYDVLETDANGRTPTHPGFNKQSFSPLHIIATNGYKAGKRFVIRNVVIY